MTFKTLAAFEEINAAFFSGDEFHDRSYIELVKDYLRRWKNEIDNIEANNYYQD